MDDFDRKIISKLRGNARASVSEIALAVNLSRTAVADRIRKLENSDIIKGYTTVINDPSKDKVSAHFEIQKNRVPCQRIAKFLRKIPEVRVCNSIAGTTDMIVKVRAESSDRIEKVRDEIASIDGVGKVKIHMILMEYFDEVS